MKQKILLDTDILVDFFHNQKYARYLFAELLLKGNLYISILSVAELRTGFTPHQADIFLPRLYKIVSIANLSLEMAELAGRFRFEYQLKGISLSTVDTLIAATAIVENCQLATNNKKDFPMKGLKLYSLQKGN